MPCAVSGPQGACTGLEFSLRKWGTARGWQLSWEKDRECYSSAPVEVTTWTWGTRHCWKVGSALEVTLRKAEHFDDQK